MGRPFEKRSIREQCQSGQRILELSLLNRVGNLKKPDLKKPGFYCWVSLVFFQDNLEKTQENWVFSRFCTLRCKIIAFFHKNLGFFMQNCIFSLQIATKNSKIHIQVCICNLSLILFPITVLFLFMMY